MENLDRNELLKLIKDLALYMNSKLNFCQNVNIFLKDDKKNHNNPLGKTAYYDPEQKKIVLYITGRYSKDILRSLAHELFHHHQQERDGNIKTSSDENYFQNDKELRNLEAEAYEKGNLIFREWEEQKNKNKKDEELYEETKRRLVKEKKKPEEKKEEQISKGEKIEREHSKTIDYIKQNSNISKKAAERLIAADHIDELPDYYDQLDKMEKGKCK